MEYPKRLIEVDLPIARISAHARREKSIRHGHISTLHIWWARRPLAACRAVICAALWPDPADELCPSRFRQDAYRVLTGLRKQVLEGGISPDQRAASDPLSRLAMPKDESDLEGLRRSLLDFIAEFANWDLSTNKFFLEASRALTQSAHESLGGEAGSRPLVVDPFAGGGSIPLEALRVGADAFASDLNPVPVLLNKVVVEYIPKYGQRLADEVRRWGAWINQEAEKELSDSYPKDKSGATPIAYFWARTILSGAPGGGDEPVQVPLMRSMWLAKKGSRKFALRWSRDNKGLIRTRARRLESSDGNSKDVIQPLLEVFQPKSDTEVEGGTSKAGSATCPITEFTTPVEGVRSQLASRRGGASDSRLVAVVVGAGDNSGRVYRLAEQSDEDAYGRAVRAFEYRRRQDNRRVSLPDGRINHLRGFFNIVLYGMERWGDLFSPRQALAITTFAHLVTQ